MNLCEMTDFFVQINQIQSRSLYEIHTLSPCNRGIFVHYVEFLGVDKSARPRTAVPAGLLYHITAEKSSSELPTTCTKLRLPNCRPSMDAKAGISPAHHLRIFHICKHMLTSATFLPKNPLRTAFDPPYVQKQNVSARARLDNQKNLIMSSQPRRIVEAFSLRFGLTFKKF